MKIIVQYNKADIEVSSAAGGVEDGDSWGQLAQRFVEQSLMHPPQLLPLLSSLSSSANNHSTGPIKRKNSDGDRYLFRFGDGYATMIRTVWGNSNHNTDGDGDCGGEMIEANITFKPRAGNKLQHQCHPTAKVPTSDSNEGSSNLHVDLIVEVVGFAGEQQRNGGKKSKGGSSGGITTFPMTQTPFPIDDTKQNLLSVREHPKFKGVVDHYTLERWIGPSGDSAAAAAAVAGGTLHTNNVESKSTSSKASPATSNTEVTQMTHSTAAILETDNLPKKNKRKKRKKSASTEQETDAKNIVDSTPQEKNNPPPKPHRNGFMMFNAEVRPRILAQHPNLSVTELVRINSASPFIRFNFIVNWNVACIHLYLFLPTIRDVPQAKKVGEEYRALTEERRQKYSDDARLAVLKYKEEHPEVELNASTKSKAKTKEDTKKKSSVMPPTPKPLPPLPPLPDSDDDTSDEEDSEEERVTGNKNNSVGLDNGGNEQKNKPKRPLNAYLLYANDVRNQVRAANPDASAAEIVSPLTKTARACLISDSHCFDLFGFDISVVACITSSLDLIDFMLLFRCVKLLKHTRRWTTVQNNGTNPRTIAHAPSTRKNTVKMQ